MSKLDSAIERLGEVLEGDSTKASRATARRRVRGLLAPKKNPTPPPGYRAKAKSTRRDRINTRIGTRINSRGEKVYTYPRRVA